MAIVQNSNNELHKAPGMIWRCDFDMYACKKSAGQPHAFRWPVACVPMQKHCHRSPGVWASSHPKRSKPRPPNCTSSKGLIGWCLRFLKGAVGGYWNSFLFTNSESKTTSMMFFGSHFPNDTEFGHLHSTILDTLGGGGGRCLAVKACECSWVRCAFSDF